MKTHNKKQQRDRLINAITHYLKAHPNAADSVEGIMQWWLPQQNPMDMDALQQALDYLVETRAMSRTALLDGHMLYTSRVKDAKLKENSLIGGTTWLKK